MSIEPDLHVETLIYRLRPNETITYNNPEPIEFETDHARFRLADGELRCNIKDHFSRPEQARTLVDPILKAWEVYSDILSNQGAIRFKYETADIVDRSPSKPGEVKGIVLMAQSGQFVLAGGSVTFRVGMNHYPEPPGRFRLTPDAESLWLRYLGYIEGREPLLSMAYFCLTVLQAISGNRSAASKKFRIQKSVLDKMGELTAERGDRLSARKVSRNRQTALTGRERNWIEATIKMFILRLGIEGDKEMFPWISFMDLPELKE